jgi:hypothetical protein
MKEIIGFLKRIETQLAEEGIKAYPVIRTGYGDSLIVECYHIRKLPSDRWSFGQEYTPYQIETAPNSIVLADLFAQRYLEAFAISPHSGATSDELIVFNGYISDHGDDPAALLQYLVDWMKDANEHINFHTCIRCDCPSFSSHFDISLSYRFRSDFDLLLNCAPGFKEILGVTPSVSEHQLPEVSVSVKRKALVKVLEGMTQIHPKKTAEVFDINGKNN